MFRESLRGPIKIMAAGDQFQLFLVDFIEA